MESRILGALSRLDHFLLNPLIQDRSGISPETSRTTLHRNHGRNDDNSQKSDPNPDARVSQSQTTLNSVLDDTLDNNKQDGLLHRYNVRLSILLKMPFRRIRKIFFLYKLISPNLFFCYITPEENLLIRAEKTFLRNNTFLYTNF